MLDRLLALALESVHRPLQQPGERVARIGGQGAIVGIFGNVELLQALPLGPKPRALSPQPASRSCCSIAFSRFLRARSMALASLGEILPVVMSVSILH